MPGDKRQDQRFLHTVQVRVRKPNPLIERANEAPIADVHIDDDPTKALPGLAPSVDPAPRVMGAMDDDNSEVASSIYDRIEHTDRSEELAEAEAELEVALEGYARASHDQLPAVVPRDAPSQEETRTYLGPEGDTAPDRATTVAPSRPEMLAAKKPTRARGGAPHPSAERDAAPRPSGERRAAPKAPRAAAPSTEMPAATRPSRERRPAPRPRSPTEVLRGDRARLGEAPADRATTALEAALPLPTPAPPPRAPEAAATPRHAPPERPAPDRAAPDRAAPDRAATTVAPPTPPRKPTAKDPTTRGRAKPKPARPARIDTEPTPVDRPADPPAAPRVAQLLDDDETVLASEPPRAGHHMSDQGAPGFRLVRKLPAAPPAAPDRAPTAALAVTPHERLAVLGTDAMGEVMKEHALQALGGNLPTVKHPALKLVRGHLGEATLSVLEGMLLGRFDAESDEPNVSIKRALERLVNDKHYGALEIEAQASLLRSFAAAPRDVTSVKAGTALLKSGVTRGFTPAHQQSLLRLFDALEVQTRVRVAQLAARKLRGRSALEDRDVQDQPLVVHLEALARAREVAPALKARGVGLSKVVGMVLGAIAHPERLSFEEGSDGVLGMLEFGLADSAPAELARMWRHLVEDDMAVPLSGGAQLDLRARLEADPSLELTGVSTPLRLALRGLAELARPSARGRKPTFIMPGGHGIDADVMARALELLYGFGFTVAAGSANAMRHLARVPEPPHRLPPVYVTLLYGRGERVFLFDHLEDDWVYLRAPRGRSSKQRGALRVDPRREVADPDRGLDRIPREAFEEKVGVGLIPRL